MGFSVFLDIIGSIIIGGIILVTLNRFTNNAAQNTYLYSGDLSVQQNLTTVSQIIEYDFRKIGFCADYTKIIDPDAVILSADTAAIKFISDIDQNGTMDTIRYYLGPTSELNVTINPRDKMLYRVLNHDVARSSNSGITRFYLIYFNPLSDTLKPPIADLGEISEIEINMNFENPYINDINSNAYYRQVKLSLQNLKNR